MNEDFESSKKIVIVTNMEAPYRVSLWNSISERCKKLDVIVLCEKEKNRKWELEPGKRKYKVHNINSSSFFINKLDSAFYFGGNIKEILHRLTPDVVIVTGYSSLPFLQSILWARKNKIPVIQWFESHLLSSRFTSSIALILRGYFLKLADRFICPGELTKSYLKLMGVSENLIFVAPNTVDVTLYNKKPEKLNERADVRFLYVGQLLKRKNVSALVKAFKNVGIPNATLRIVGYGDEEDKILKLIKDCKSIEFVGSINDPSLMAEQYCWADIVVMPSDIEVWGLVVNEALAAGCFVIASCKAGASKDLIKDSPHYVGELMPMNNPVAELKYLITNTINSINHIRESRPSIQKWGQSINPNNAARSVITAVENDKKYENL